jgi:hypothetical protein
LTCIWIAWLRSTRFWSCDHLCVVSSSCASCASCARVTCGAERAGHLVVALRRPELALVGADGELRLSEGGFLLDRRRRVDRLLEVAPGDLLMVSK